jgi:hypothetical protein
MWIDAQAIVDRTGYANVHEEDLKPAQLVTLRGHLADLFTISKPKPSEITRIMVRPSGQSVRFTIGVFDCEVKVNPNTGKPLKSPLREIRTGGRAYP